MRESRYKYDPERKEFVPRRAEVESVPERNDVVSPEIGQAAARSSAPGQMQRRRRRRKRRSTFSAGSFAEAGKGGKGRRRWYIFWTLIAAIVMAWLVMLSKGYKGKVREPKADPLYIIEKDEVVPDL